MIDEEALRSNLVWLSSAFFFSDVLMNKALSSVNIVMEYLGLSWIRSARKRDNAPHKPRAKAHRLCESGARSARTVLWNPLLDIMSLEVGGRIRGHSRDCFSARKCIRRLNIPNKPQALE
jgi:hypothetical protein